MEGINSIIQIKIFEFTAPLNTERLQTLFKFYFEYLNFIFSVAQISSHTYKILPQNLVYFMYIHLKCDKDKYNSK